METINDLINPGDPHSPTEQEVQEYVAMGYSRSGAISSLTTTKRNLSQQENEQEEHLSILGRRCLKFGLDPNNTSIFDLECVKFGLDPNNSSIVELKAVQLGLSKDVSSTELEKFGVDISGSIEIWTEDDE
jgi:hypothetical protein